VYQLHITNKNYSSWSLRPWLLMRHLGIPFTEHLHPFPESGVWETFRRFSPNGRVPCLIDGGHVIWDSLAITEYLAEVAPQVWPQDRDARTWARCAAAEMHSGFMALRSHCGMSCGVRVAMTRIPDIVMKDVARIDELWCEGLGRFGGPFLAGARFSAVDAFFAPVVFRAQTYGLPLSAPAAGYRDWLLTLPAMIDWYQAALAEGWREPAHEAEVAAAGKVVADFRAAAQG
jgi:glutathione S-transferase